MADKPSLTEAEHVAAFVEAVRVYGFPLDNVERYVAQYGEPYRAYILGAIDYLYEHRHPKTADVSSPLNLDEYMRDVMHGVTLQEDGSYVRI